MINGMGELQSSVWEVKHQNFVWQVEALYN